MCEFVSYIEMPDGEIRFLTADMIFKTRRGKELQRHDPNRDAWVGHGAIMFYYEMTERQGKQRECTDFSTPDNFPKKIVIAIKAGKMAIKGVPFPVGLLTAPLYADYEAKRDALYADYEAKRDALDADYEAKRAPLYADYEAKRAPLYADYKAKRDALYADYKAKRAPLYADYKAKRDALYADYEAKRDALYAAMWKLFELSENRNPLWR